MSKVLIIGGGAAGMSAAIFAARNGNEVHLYEKNEKLGKKIFITGKGRCNLTNNCDMEELFAHVVTNDKFMYSSFYGFSNRETMEFFEDLGLKIKTERGGRVFPQSDHSSDVIRVLDQELRKQNVHVHLYTTVRKLLVREEAEDCEDLTSQFDGTPKKVKKTFCGLELADGSVVTGDACVVATGGLSYPTTGSTGDGYTFARELGHTVTPLLPSLVPMEVLEDDAKEMMGLSLKNVQATILDGKKKLYNEFGEMLFTHFGVSGPLIISASAYVGKQLEKKKGLLLSIDLKPALTQEQLDARVLREFEAASNKQFKNCLGNLLPAKMIPVIIRRSEIDPEKKVNIISKEERLRLVYLMKHLEYHVTKLRDYKEAIITKGGIKVKEIDPSTMQSKLVQGVYFAGEVLDVDALTGGFNLQVAWSTGCSAGESIW